MGIQLKVNGPKGEEKIIDLCDSDRELRKITVTQLMEKISDELNISTEEMRIIFRTEPLEETSLVLSYGIKHMSTIQIVRKLPGGIIIRCGPGEGGKTPTDPKHAAVTPIMIMNYE